jgi:galactokinase
MLTTINTANLSASELVAEMQEMFRMHYGTAARIYRAPGRVNLIGEHTDYNNGFVMPAAIAFSVWVAIASRNDHKVKVFSERFYELVEIDLDNNSAKRNHWSDYIAGTAAALGRVQNLRGANIFIHSDVPAGSRLSSSAAIEVATGLALMENSGFRIPRTELARLCQIAECEFVGIRVGIMDQFISCCGEADHALMLDCRSLKFGLIRLPREVRLVTCNTMVKRELVTSEYGLRRTQCQEGLRSLARRLPRVRALRDITLANLAAHAGEMPEVVYRKCRHVVSENSRVQDYAAAMEAGDVQRIGDLMYASHLSLRNDYEVSCPKLDLMVDLARQHNGLIGTRMTGGGFGGCTINLVKGDEVGQFQARIAEAYEAQTGLKPEVFASAAAEKAGEVLG